MVRSVVAFIVLVFISLPISSARTYLGVEEFSSRNDAEKMLQKIYGVLNVRDDGGDLVVNEPSFAGFKFSLANLYFTPIDGVYRFNGISFQRWFPISQVDKAKEFRDAIMNSIRKKYGDAIYAEFDNDQDFKCCEFMNDNNTSHGMLELYRSKGKDGKERLYVFLSYSPFDRTAMESEL